MTDEDFKAAFRKLDRVEPSVDFLANARAIPLRYPREERSSLWQFLRRSNRWATLALSASFGLTVGYLTLEEEGDDPELSAFLALDGDATFTTSADVDWDNP